METRCNSSSITTLLTESAEACLEADNQASSNCEYNSFSTIPPYTDLTYPVDLWSVDSNVSYKRDDVVLIVVTVVLAILLVGSIIAFIVWYRKPKGKKAKYEKISP